MEYASLVGAKLPDTQTTTESMVSSVETAITWTQDKFKELESSARQMTSNYSAAVMGLNEFTAGLTKCSNSIDVAVKNFRQAIRKLLVAGVDVSPSSKPAAHTPVNPELVTNPTLVRDQAAALFALEGDISRIKSDLEVCDYDSATVSLYLNKPYFLRVIDSPRGVMMQTLVLHCFFNGISGWFFP